MNLERCLLVAVLFLSTASSASFCFTELTNTLPTGGDPIGGEYVSSEGNCRDDCYANPQCKHAQFKSPTIGLTRCLLLRSFTGTTTDNDYTLFTFNRCCPERVPSAGMSIVSTYASATACSVWQEVANGNSCSHSCAAGYELNGSVTSLCSSNAWSTSMPACDVCPANTYRSGGTGCVSCPANTVTVGNTAADHDSVSDCKCAKGFVGPDGGPCTVPAVHTYKDSIGSAGATSCPNGRTAFGVAAVDHDDVSDCREAVVTAVEPAFIPEDGGTEVTITGRFFGVNATAAAFDAVRLGSADCNSIAQVATLPTYIGCYMDVEGAAGDLSVGAEVSSASMSPSVCNAECSSQGYQFFGLKKETLCRCGNAYGVHGVSSGCSFACPGDALASCGGNDTLAVYETASSFSCTASSRSPADVQTQIRVNGGYSSSSGPTVTYYKIPSSFGLTPTTCPKEGGAVITLSGSDLINSTDLACKIGAVVVPGTLTGGGGSVTCTAPATTIPGGDTSVDKMVHVTLNGQDFHSSGLELTYHLSLSLTAFFPPAIPENEAAEVYAFGSPFFEDGSLAACKVNGTLVSAAFVSSTVISFMAPARSAGEYPVQVSNNGQQFSPSLLLTFYGKAVHLELRGSLGNVSNNVDPLPEVDIYTVDSSGVIGDAASRFTIRAVVVPADPASTPPPVSVSGNVEQTAAGFATFDKLTFVGARGHTYSIFFEELAGPNVTALTPIPPTNVTVITCPEAYANTVVSEDNPESCVCAAGHENPTASSIACTPCAAGAFKRTIGRTKCDVCPPGFVSTATGATECQPCPPGTYSFAEAGNLRSECVGCSPGYFAGTFATGQCQAARVGHFVATANSTNETPCAPGMFADSRGQQACSPCPAGSYAPGNGTFMCSTCPVGHYAPASGHAACIPCNPGQFMASTGALSCSNCPEGSFSNATASAQCYDCPKGFFSKSGKTSCEACPPGQFSSQPRASGCTLCATGAVASSNGTVLCSECPSFATSNAEKTMCVCVDDYYPVTDSGKMECKPCPNGATCNGGGMPVAKSGFFRVEDSLFLQCFPKSACKGGISSGCAKGYTGERCSECVREPKEDRHYHTGDTCSPCDKIKYPWLLLVLTAIFLCFLVYASAVLSGAGGNSAMTRVPKSGVSIMITTFQVLSLLKSVDLSWPDSFLGTLRFLSFLSLDLSYVSPDCADPMSTFYRVLFAMMTPVVGIGITTIMFSIVSLLSKCCCPPPEGKAVTKAQSARKWLHRAAQPAVLLRACMEFLHLSYMLEVSTALATFTCHPLDDGTAVLEAYPETLCYRPEWRYSVLPLGISGMVVYAAGIPFLVAILLFRFRNQRDDPKVSLWLGNIYGPFRDKVFWWMLTDYMYKVMLGLSVAVLSKNAIVRSFSAFMVMLITLCVNILVYPFEHYLENFIQFAGLVVSMFVLVLGLFFHAFPDDKETDIVGNFGVAFIVVVGLAMMAATVYIARMNLQEMLRQYKDSKGDAGKEEEVPDDPNLLDGDVDLAATFGGFGSDDEIDFEDTWFDNQVDDGMFSGGGLSLRESSDNFDDAWLFDEMAAGEPDVVDDVMPDEFDPPMTTEL